MATEITMPKLSDTMTEGSFIGWRKSVGERVERGDVIAEVETDKAVMELEAFASGVLLKTLVTGGETVPVGTLLGLIGEPGEETVAASAPTLSPPAVAPPEPAAPAPGTEAPGVQPEAEEHEKASPLVRRLARERGIDLTRIQGSGPEGRILQQDLDAAMASATPVTESPVPESPPLPAAAPAGTGAEPSAMRRAIAATVSRSWQQIPHFGVTMEIPMEGCRQVVAELKESGTPVGYQALVIAACSRVLPQFPLLLPGGADAAASNISFAVALPDGLLMPVIRNCPALPAAGIEREAARLADKARTGRLTSEELTGGHFSVSNLGMFGVDEFSALIMPGQMAILALGAVADRVVARAGQPVVAPTMRVTLCSDHRAVDGAYAAAFLAELRRVLEHPVALLL